MEQQRTSRPLLAGYLVVLLGVAVWVTGCFLPLYRSTGFGGFTTTLFNLITTGSQQNLKIGGSLVLFGGIATLLVIGVVGILGGSSGRWIEGALVGTAIAWSLTSVGFLVIVGNSSYSLAPSPKAVGYWVLVASVVCIALGTVVVVISGRGASAKRGGVAPQVEVR